MPLTLIAVPYDSGQRGARMGAGPLHLLERGLATSLEAAGLAVDTVVVDLGGAFPTEITTAVELQRRVARAVGAAREAGRLPVVLSGNCNSAVGTVAGVGPLDTGVLWFDAHGDLNTPETSPSGFFDGMALTMLMGSSWTQLAATVPGWRPVPERHVALVGVRELDPGEEVFLKSSDAVHVRPEDLAGESGWQTLDALARRVGGLYVHVDLDVLDPAVLRANHFAAAGGLSLEQLLEIIERTARVAPLRALSFTAYDPAADERDPGPEVVLRILRAAADLAAAH